MAEPQYLTGLQVGAHQRGLDPTEDFTDAYLDAEEQLEVARGWLRDAAGYLDRLDAWLEAQGVTMPMMASLPTAHRMAKVLRAQAAEL